MPKSAPFFLCVLGKYILLLSGIRLHKRTSGPGNEWSTFSNKSINGDSEKKEVQI